MPQNPSGPLQSGFDLLTMTLGAAVPLRIMELLRKGGPNQEDFERITSYQEDLTAHGEDLFFRHETNHATATRFNQVADAIAVLSFVPGGITAFGMHFDGNEMQTLLAKAKVPSREEGNDG